MASPTQSCFESACPPIATETSPRSSRCVCYDASRRMGVFPWIFQYEIRHVLHSEKRMSTVKSVGPTRRADAEAARARGWLRPRSAQQHGLRARAPCRPGWCGCQPTPRTVRPHARGRVPCPQHLSAAFPQGSHAALAFFLSCGVSRERGGRALTPGPTEPLACPSLCRLKGSGRQARARLYARGFGDRHLRPGRQLPYPKVTPGTDGRWVEDRGA